MNKPKIKKNEKKIISRMMKINEINAIEII
jgi:hypothetical protein